MTTTKDQGSKREGEGVVSFRLDEALSASSTSPVKGFLQKKPLTGGETSHVPLHTFLCRPWLFSLAEALLLQT